MSFRDSKYAKLNEFRRELREKEKFKKSAEFRKSIILKRVEIHMARWRKEVDSNNESSFDIF